jgi:hypothetical protein
MLKTRIKASRQPKGLKRISREDHKFTMASLALLAFLLITGFSAWIFNSSTAAVHPQSEYAGHPF